MESRRESWLPQQSFDVCPLVPVALWLIIGIVLSTVPVLTSCRWWTTAAALLPLAVALCVFSPVSKLWLALFAVIGAAVGILHIAAPWQTYHSSLPRPVCGAAIRAVVVDEAAAAESDIWNEGTSETLARLQAVKTSADPEWQPCRGLLLIRIFNRERIPYGTTIEATGRFVLPEEPIVESSFNYARYLRAQGVQHIFQTDGVRELAGATGWRRMIARLQQFRAGCARRLVSGISDGDNARMLTAMALGYKEGLDYRTREMFIRSGAVHVFAISGLHVGIAAGVLMLILHLLRAPYRWRYAVLPVLLGLYVFMTGSAASAVRAWMMISIWSLAKASFRSVAPLNAVATAAVALLLWNPLSIMGVGFQFSFIIVTVLVLGWGSTARGTRVLREKVRWVPLRLRNGRWQSWRYSGVSIFLRLTACSALAWLAGAGLVAYYNNLVIPVAVIVNIGVSVLAYLGLATALFKLIIGTLGISLLDSGIGWVLDMILSTTRILAGAGTLPGASLTVAKPALAFLLVYYGLLTALLLPPIRGFSRSAIAASLLILIVLVVVAPPLTRGPQITCLYGGGEREPVIIFERGHLKPPLVVYGARSYRMARTVGNWLHGRGYGRLRYCILPSPRRPRSLPTAWLHKRISVESEVLPSVRRLRESWAFSSSPRIRAGGTEAEDGGQYEAADINIRTIRKGKEALHSIQYDDAGYMTTLLMTVDSNSGTRLRVRHENDVSPEFRLPFSERPEVVSWTPRAGRFFNPKWAVKNGLSPLSTGNCDKKQEVVTSKSSSSDGPRLKWYVEFRILNRGYVLDSSACAVSGVTTTDCVTRKA